MQKNHTKIGVAWGSVVLNGPQRVNFFCGIQENFPGRFPVNNQLQKTAYQNKQPSSLPAAQSVAGGGVCFMW